MHKGLTAPEFPDSDEIAARAAFLQEVAALLAATPAFAQEERIIFRTKVIDAVADAYFLLNHAYKKWRIEPGHRTEPPKIAALTCLAIGTLQPIRPVLATQAETLVQMKCNEMYGLACASAIMGCPIKEDKPVFYNRLLDVLTDCESETLQIFVEDRNLNNNRELSTYNLSILNTDKAIINSLVTIFELLYGKYD